MFNNKIKIWQTKFKNNFFDSKKLAKNYLKQSLDKKSIDDNLCVKKFIRQIIIRQKKIRKKIRLKNIEELDSNNNFRKKQIRPVRQMFF